MKDNLKRLKLDIYKTLKRTYKHKWTDSVDEFMKGAKWISMQPNMYETNDKLKFDLLLSYEDKDEDGYYSAIEVKVEKGKVVRVYSH